MAGVAAASPESAGAAVEAAGSGVGGGAESDVAGVAAASPESAGAAVEAAGSGVGGAANAAAAAAESVGASASALTESPAVEADAATEAPEMRGARVEATGSESGGAVDAAAAAMAPTEPPDKEADVATDAPDTRGAAAEAAGSESGGAVDAAAAATGSVAVAASAPTEPTAAGPDASLCPGQSSHDGPHGLLLFFLHQAHFVGVVMLLGRPTFLAGGASRADSLVAAFSAGSGSPDERARSEQVGQGQRTVARGLNNFSTPHVAR